MSKAAPRYAKALLEALTAFGELERTLPLWRGIAALPQESMDLLGNPTIPLAKRSQALRLALGDPPDDSILGRLVPLLALRRRLGEIDSIARSLLDQYEVRTGVARGIVRSPRPLSDVQVKTLERTLSTAGTSVQLAQETDPSILGGFRVRLGSNILDATVNNQLNQARRALLSA